MISLPPLIGKNRFSLEIEYMYNYNSTSHDRWREKVLRAGGYLCYECKRYGKRVPAKVAHHIVPPGENPELSHVVSNGRALCMACHNKAHPEKADWKAVKHGYDVD